MRTVQVYAYTFRDLIREHAAGNVSAAAVDRAREYLRHWADDDWADDIISDWIEALADVGFHGADIRWTGFASQGDGASFEAKVEESELVRFGWAGARPYPKRPDGSLEVDGAIQWDRWIVSRIGECSWDAFERDWVSMAGEGDISIRLRRVDHRYSHECTVSVDVDATREESDIQRRVQSLYRAICRAIYADLEAEHERRETDEFLCNLSAHHIVEFDDRGRTI